jgi:hypothetical protein
MITRYLTGVVLSAVMTTASAARAQSVRLAVGADSKLLIEGGSNLHSWSCKATAFDAAIDVDESFPKSGPMTASAVKNALITVPVRNLKCGHGGMDNDLYKAREVEGTQYRRLAADGSRVRRRHKQRGRCHAGPG